MISYIDKTIYNTVATVEMVSRVTKCLWNLLLFTELYIWYWKVSIQMIDLCVWHHMYNEQLKVDWWRASFSYILCFLLSVLEIFHNDQVHSWYLSGHSNVLLCNNSLIPLLITYCSSLKKSFILEEQDVWFYHGTNILGWLMKDPFT